MKVIICCPNCGNENLILTNDNNPYVYRCSKCSTYFNIGDSGFNTFKSGEVSDGSHIFDELYYHRMVLFSVICNTYKEKAWKSWKHDDGTMFDDYFIVGVTTPEGNYTYHYHKDYWDRFDVSELEKAPTWDDHQPSDINRLYSLFIN